MEQLIQKHIRYFYFTMIAGIMIQLLYTIYASLVRGNVSWEIFTLMTTSIINIILLANNLRHNIKQQFTECKENSKILRFTLGILLLLQCMICYSATGSIIMLFNHFMTIGVVEIVLTYRIKTIEYLEKLANKYKYSAKEKGEVKECKE